ncbi:DUF1697 domain-containing protein [Kaarinaea lacus]
MTIYISMLRGINVSGQKKIKMAELKTLYESAGFSKVTTYIQSGNVVFSSSSTNTSEIKKSIKDQIKTKLGYSVAVILRNANEFRKIINNNPFIGADQIDTSKLHITFLSDKPRKEKIEALEPTGGTSDQFQTMGKEIYLYCPNGYARTKLSNNFFEKKLALIATTRNWNTINKLQEIATAL